jgi:hypothetical protein
VFIKNTVVFSPYKLNDIQIFSIYGMNRKNVGIGRKERGEAKNGNFQKFATIPISPLYDISYRYLVLCLG